MTTCNDTSHHIMTLKSQSVGGNARQQLTYHHNL